MLKPNSTAARDVLFHLHSQTNHLHSQTNPTLHAEIGPLVMTRGEGVHVYGADGKRYLEAMAAYDKFGFYRTFNHKAPDAVIDLAEKLVALSPIPEAQAYFTTSGSEATETMVCRCRSSQERSLQG